MFFRVFILPVCAYEIFAYSVAESLKLFCYMLFKAGNEDNILQAFCLLSVCDK